MNKLLTTLFALAVTCVTAAVHAQAPAPAAVSAPAPAAAPVAAAPAGAKSLEAKTAMCIGCHGIRGYQASFPEVYRVPMISGQNPKYIIAALTAYKNGDRKHPTMRGIADSLSEQDINDIANYYATRGVDANQHVADKPSHEPNAQVAALLQKAACVSCHGSNFSKPIENYPKIAGQHNDYLFAALRAYKMENNPTMGRNNAVMGAIARQFSSAELKALASYVGSLDTELKTLPESRFR
ncbi:MAG: cytochrome-like protein [Ramlibacter sp.]|nr:cytochrome-like protein [Ramlibacter sp.]